MKRLAILSILIITAVCCKAQTAVRSTEHRSSTGFAIPSSDNGDGTYTNPVIRGDYPDTDIIRVGSDYYMISSSFACMPGIPVCHSKDLVNWRVIGHAYDQLTFLPSYSMERQQTAYGRACWAPTMRYHDGWFYIGVNLKSDRFVMFKSRRPEGPYTMHPFAEELYDPGLFIDDDGRKYVTHGQNDIRITELNDEGTEIKTPGDKGTVILRATEAYHLYFEGCHTYKRNGWYYIFNPAQGYSGVQMVSRSRNLYGPYETRVLMDDDVNYRGAGVHQGGYVDTDCGESWAFMFQDRDYMGRDMMLFPMRWVDDWPVVGLDPDPSKITPDLARRIGRLHEGKGVVTYRKPTVSAPNDQTTDHFDNTILGQLWEFSHVPVSEKWSLQERKGHLRLYAMPAKGYEWARNSLTRKIVGPASTATVKVDVSHLQPGDFAGHGIMGSTMLQQGVMRMADGQLQLQMRQSKHVADQTVCTASLPADTRYIYLQTSVTKQGTVCFAYSLDGTGYTRFGQETPSGFWRFLGLRHALCCYQHSEANDSSFYTTETLRHTRSGYADFDCFTVETPYYGNNYDAFRLTDFDLYDDLHDMTLVRPNDYDPRQHLLCQHQGAWASFFNLHFPKQATSCAIELKAKLSNAVIELHDGDAQGPLLATFRIKATGGKWSVQRFSVSIPAGIHKLTFVATGGTEQLQMKNFQFQM